MITQEMEFSNIPPCENDWAEQRYMHQMDISLMLEMLSRFIPERLERIEKCVLYESYYMEKTLREIAKALSSLGWVRNLRKGRPADIYYIIRIRQKALRKLLDAFHEHGIQGYDQ